MDHYNKPARPWTQGDMRNTSWWIRRSIRDNTAGTDRVDFCAFIPRGADAAEIALASNMLKRKVKAFVKRASARGFAPTETLNVRPGIFPRRRGYSYDDYIDDGDNMELRDWCYFKIGIYEVMEVPL